MSPPPHSRDFAEYVSLLRRRCLIFATFLLAGVAGSVVALVVTPPRYTSVAQVYVLPTGVRDQVNQVTARQREFLNLDTESQIAKSAVVASRAAQILKNADPEKLRELMTVEVPPNSAVLSISFTASDPNSAAAGAQAFAEAYLGHRSDSVAEALAAELKIVSAKLRQVNAELAQAVTAAPAPAPGGKARTLASHQQSLLVREAIKLTLRQDALRTTAITPGTVITPARPPDRPSSPSVPIYLGSGLFLGLLAGSGAALARDRLDTRLRTQDDVERLTGLPLFGELPPLPEPTNVEDLAATIVATLGDPVAAPSQATHTSRPYSGRAVPAEHPELTGAVPTAGRRGKIAPATPSVSAQVSGQAVTLPFQAAGDDRGRISGTTLLIEGVGPGMTETARAVATLLYAPLARLAPIRVTARNACPDTALLLVGLPHTTTPEVARAVRRLARRGASVLGVVTVSAKHAR